MRLSFRSISDSFLSLNISGFRRVKKKPNLCKILIIAYLSQTLPFSLNIDFFPLIGWALLRGRKTLLWSYKSIPNHNHTLLLYLAMVLKLDPEVQNSQNAANGEFNDFSTLPKSLPQHWIWLVFTVFQGGVNNFFFWFERNPYVQDQWRHLIPFTTTAIRSHPAESAQIGRLSICRDAIWHKKPTWTLHRLSNYRIYVHVYFF